MRRRSFRRLALVLALAGALHGLLYVPLVQSNEGTDSWTYTAAAHALDRGHYSTPLRAGFYYVYPSGFYDITGIRLARSLWQTPEHQAFRPPGYPAFLALFGGGGGGASQTLVLLAQAVLFGAGVLLLAATVRRWWGETPALLAAALYALDPWSKHYVALVLSDELAAFLALAGAYAFTRAWEERATVWWVATAALASALTLTRAVFVLVLPLLLVAALLRSRRSALAALAAAAVLLLPWLGWTWHVTGKPVLASWGEGFNLLLAAEGEGHGRSAAAIEADPAFLTEVRRVHRFLPSAATLRRDANAHPRYLRRADDELRTRARSLYAHRLRHRPAQVAWEVTYRAGFLWSAHQDWFQPRRPALYALWLIDWLTIALALAGAAIAWARRGPGRGIVVLLLAYTAVLATHHVEARFALPLRGFLLALGALALSEAATLRRRSGRRGETRTARTPR
jgi:4-amino-4-deoxy-L-arabinose transferase-like glycosyltransferase